MMHVRKFLAVLMMLFAATALAGEGGGSSGGEPEYTMLNPAQPTSSGNKIEVLEFYFYGCPHCYHLQVALRDWKKTMPKDVKLDFVPVAFSPSAEPMAYTYYALRDMGQLAKLHDKLYDAWNVDHLYLTETDAIADFVARQGVDRQKFLDFYNSFTVLSEVKASKQMVKTYQIEGTPTLIVDGRYIVPSLGPENTIRVLDEVIKKVRKEHGKR